VGASPQDELAKRDVARAAAAAPVASRRADERSRVRAPESAAPQAQRELLAAQQAPAEDQAQASASEPPGEARARQPSEPSRVRTRRGAPGS
jgi:hypothetical protein